MDYIIKSLIAIIVGLVIIYGMINKVKIYECFIEGAKEGVEICTRIFPYLLAMIVAVGVFRESNALNYFINIITPICNFIGLPPEVVPLTLIKPLSGSGALGVFAETLKTYGVDSYIGQISSVIMGSTETIFYTLTVYFGCIKIKKIRHTLWAAIIADLTAIIMAVNLVKIMF